MRSLIYTLLIAFLSVPGILRSQDDCFPKKNDSQLVYDEVGVLNAGEVKNLDSKLQEFARSSSNQIVVVIVSDICGMDRAQYATELGHAWGVGQAEFDNGVVVLVKPTGGQGERHVYIAVGYGLEGAIPDITAKQIIDYELLPDFRNSRFYEGLDKGTNVLIELALGEYNSEVYAKQKQRGSWIGALVILLIFGLVIFVFISRARQYSRVNDINFWTALWLLSNTGRSHRGSWGGSSGGGFGGGGFGGFGGGGFGGGGAGGSW